MAALVCALGILGNPQESLGQSLSWSLQGEAIDDALGTSIASGLDIDGDTVPDVVVGFPQVHAPIGFNRGGAKALSGVDGQLIWEWEGEDFSDGFGFSVALVDDLDGDERAEILVGAPQRDTTGGVWGGSAYLYDGATGSLLHRFDGGNTGNLGDSLGASLAGIGDIDADEVPDILIGAPRFDGVAGSWSGIVYAYSGSDFSLIRAWEGASAFEYFGGAIGNAGDVNGDLVDDVIAGAPRAEGVAGRLAGRADVLSGADGSLIWSWEGDLPLALFGSSVAGAGDIDGDTFADLIIGAPEYDSIQDHPNAGFAAVFRGIDGARVWDDVGPLADVAYGNAVSSAGDVDGDGYDDVMVGARGWWGDSGWGHGRVDIRSGPSGAVIQYVEGAERFDELGFSVAKVGDIDLDGASDYALGAHGVDGGAGAETGELCVYRGRRCILTYTPFGEGLAGTDGFVPVLSGTDGSCDPTLHDLQIADAIGAGMAIFWIGALETDVPLFGGHFYIDFSGPFSSFVFNLAGAPGAGGEGHGTLVGHAFYEQIGLSIVVQVTIVDPGAVEGIALSNGLRIEVSS